MPQSNTSTQIVHTTQGLVRLFPDWFQGFGNFQGVPYHIVIDPSVPPKKTPCRSMSVHQKAAIVINGRQQASSIKLTVPLHGSTVLL